MSITVFDPRTGKMVTICPQEKPRADRAPERRDGAAHPSASERVRLPPKGQ
jgi:hypothetical protein